MISIFKFIRRIVLTVFLLLALIIPSFSMISCKKNYKVFSYDFLGTFDTVISIVAHLETQKEFDEFREYTENRFIKLNQFYDIYHNYEGINNIKTINDMAGKNPVVVDKEIMDLLLLSKEWYEKTNSKVNIALGSVLKVWHDYREMADEESNNNKIPTLDELRIANLHTSITQLELDIAKSTAFIKDPKVLLNVGAIAKGYATEIVANELKTKGYKSFAISAGGNVKVVGKPLAKDRDTWLIGIQNPDPEMDLDAESGLINKVSVVDQSVVTSGWYQRYFKSGGKIYHHIIDPMTLFPQNYYQAVTIIYPDSGISDILSTAVMLMPYEEAVKFLEKIPGVNAYFILMDGSVKVTKGMEKLLVNPISE